MRKRYPREHVLILLTGYGPVEDRMVGSKVNVMGTLLTSLQASTIIASLLYLESESSEPVNMYIMSPGGSVSAGLAIYDTMQVSQNTSDLILDYDCVTDYRLIVHFSTDNDNSDGPSGLHGQSTRLCWVSGQTLHPSTRYYHDAPSILRNSRKLE